MTTLEYISKAKCCSGQLAYEAVVAERNGDESCYKKKLAQSRILQIIATSLQCYEDGGTCLTDKQAQILKERVNQLCGCCDCGSDLTDIEGNESDALIDDDLIILIDDNYGVTQELNYD